MDWKYFRHMPTEVLEHIFSYLNTIDMINVSSICNEFENVCYSRRLIRKIDVSSEYQITSKHIHSFISKKPRSEMITLLNISFIYWIPAADIRKCLVSLTSLESLYAIDTKISLLKPDYNTYSSIPKLKRLAISASKRTFCKDSLQNFPKVTHFYLHMDYSSESIIKTILTAINKIGIAEELWFIESGGMTMNDLICLLNLPHSIKKLTLLSYNLTNCKYSYLYNYNLRRLFRTTLNGMQSCWECTNQDIVPLYELDTQENVYWSHLLKLFRYDCPFSVKQSKELLFKKYTLENIHFDELNFLHGDLTCGDLYLCSINSVLLYSNMKFLRKLSLSYCACIEVPDPNEPSHQLKKQKLHDEKISSRSNCLLHKISENSPAIEELELWSCKRADFSSKVTNSSLCSIINFKNLKKLTLDNIPPHLNGAFLINVCSSCQYLTSLRIKSRQQNSTLHNMLCLALKKAVTLKDIRYEHPCNISIDKLFEALLENKTLKLSRLFIKCKSVEIFSVRPFRKFLEINRDLKFLYIVISCLPKVVIREAMKSLNEYRSDPQKIFVITQDEFNYTGRIQIPNFHTYDMIKFVTNVSVIDIFKGFYN